METAEKEIIELIKSVEHPEIANTLEDLGMLGDIKFDEETKQTSITLVLPMMNIPIDIRNMILNSIADKIRDRTSKLNVSLAEMTEEQRTNFFSLSQKNWKL
ncbi:MAG: DUF59 domain-containing protein [Chlorobi bacterium]|nr:DUF59 domain-containing protein [Chlorobiota bacterium]